VSSSERAVLDELFHQPVRLEIMAELCSSADGKSFTELREKCGLTDGNLSRHLQALAKAGAVKIKKTFLKSRPLTTAVVTTKGRESFLQYLTSLEAVLQDALARTQGEPQKEAVETLPGVKYAKR